MSKTKKKQEYTVHPAAEAFPWMSKEDFSDLKSDIKARGVINPVVLIGTEIIDGRNRMAACDELGVECPTTQYKGTDPVGYVIAQNILRRNLTDEQRVALVAKLRGVELSAEAKAAQKDKKSRGAVGKRIAAEAKVSGHKGRQAAEIMKDSPAMLDEVIAGREKLSAAKKKTQAAKPPKVKKEKSLDERVRIKFVRFMESFTPQEYPKVRELVRGFVALADKSGHAALTKAPAAASNGAAKKKVGKKKK